MNQLTIEQRLANAQQAIQQAQMKKIQAETRLESSSERREELAKRSQALGVGINELDQHIEMYLEKLNAGVTQLEQSLNPQTTVPLPDVPPSPKTTEQMDLPGLPF